MMSHTHSPRAVKLFGAKTNKQTKKKHVFFSGETIRKRVFMGAVVFTLQLNVIDSLCCYSLIAPVEANGDVPLDLASLVLREVALD